MKRLPRYNQSCRWEGGDSRTLYAFIDKRTGTVKVRPGALSEHAVCGIGPECDVRIATRTEAETHWQNPLHSGWKVKP
jgi:hypothetical protein